MALWTYWMLFLALPPFAVLLATGMTGRGFLVAVLLILVLLTFGSHGFRIWKKVWRIHE